MSFCAFLEYCDGMPCNRGHVPIRYTDGQRADCQTLRETVLVKVVVDVRGIELVDEFNESLLHRRLESSFREETALPRCQSCARSAGSRFVSTPTTWPN